MNILLIFAFLSGLVTILAPCIWPLLPIVLSTSATGGKSKALGITLGIMGSFSFFTLTISYLVQLFHLDPNLLRLFAVVIIGILGLTLLVPKLSALLEREVSKLSGKFGAKKPGKNGFWGGLLTGLSLGIVWTPCAGPILATIATLSATQTVNIQVVLVTLSYVSGIGIPLFFFTYAGSIVLTKSKRLSPYTGRIQQIFGIIMMLTALAIYTNYDKVIETRLLDAFPSYSDLLLKLETNQAVTQGLNTLKGNPPSGGIDERNVNMPFPIAGALPKLGPAPEFTKITRWLNTDKPLTMADLRGKVVLIDFWTYTCINCIRTLPHVTSWYDKYKDQGFVVIGVHTPEFAFEKETPNVENAIKQFNIHYPVAQDNDYGTWNAYKNEYWPAEYLIDKDGVIRHTHFGEGEYDQTEEVIQTLLKEEGKTIASSLEHIKDQTPTSQISPETYIGNARMEFYYPGGNLGSGKKVFTLGKNLPENQFNLGGEWTIGEEYSQAGKNATLDYNFIAGKVFLVMQPPPNGKGNVRVYLDGKQISDEVAGSDVKNGVVTIETDRLYNLVDLKGKTENHLLHLKFEERISLYAFTFG